MGYHLADHRLASRLLRRSCRCLDRIRDHNAVGCDTTSFADSYGDGCDWYYDNLSDCGNYDTEDFHANDDCCACMTGGGSSTITYMESTMDPGDYSSYSSITMEPEVIDGGWSSYSYSAVSYEPEITGGYSSYSYTTTTYTTEPVVTSSYSYSTSSYSTEYTVTIDADGNYIYPEGYEEIDPNDPSTWPGYEE